MKIDIKAVKFDLDTKSRDYAAEKVGKLEKYYKNIVRAEIVLEKHAGDTANVRYGAKARLFIPGHDLFAEEFSKDIMTAIDMMTGKLKEQLTKSKDKNHPNKIHRAKKWVKGFFGEE